MSRQGGAMVIAYQQDGRDYQSGGWTKETAADMVPAMEEIGCTIIRIFDGIAEAREKFPPGTRVIAPRKHWKSQVGTVEAGAEWSCTDMGAEVPVRFDGDERVLGWWASGLQVLARPAGEENGK